MIDYTNHIYNSIIVTGFATWAEFCKHKPNSIKRIITASGDSVLVHKNSNHNKHHYYRTFCAACKCVRIIRADVLGLWAKTGHTCRCKRKRKPYANTEAQKHCPGCCRSLSTSSVFWYISKAGYLSSKCKQCHKTYSQSRYEYKFSQNRRRYEAGG